MSDADALRRAAVVLRVRAKKPGGIWVSVLCRILNEQADLIEVERRKGVGRG